MEVEHDLCLSLKVQNPFPNVKLKAQTHHIRIDNEVF